VKLASELQKRSTGRTVYVLDEPTTGLHFEDIRKLLLVLQGLVDKGNTVIVIEHNLDVIKSADYLIDMGPEGGHRGGLVLATGTPEELAAVPDSHTGQFLKALVTPAVPGQARRASARSATAAAQVANTNGKPAKKVAKAPAQPAKAAAKPAKKAAAAKAK
jgi:excinuclease ABC subunit A